VVVQGWEVAQEGAPEVVREVEQEQEEQEVGRQREAWEVVWQAEVG